MQSTLIRLRSIYRSLHRQSSSLPDDNIKIYYQVRWRTIAGKAYKSILSNETSNPERRNGPSSHGEMNGSACHARSQIASLSKDLRYVTRANKGDLSAYEILMNNTYGRRGRRKHEFINVHLNQPQAPYPKRIKLSSPLPLPPQLSRLVRQQKAYTPSSLSETLKPLSRRRMINREWKERWGSLNRVQLPLVMEVGGRGKNEEEIEKLGKRLLRGLEDMSGGAKVGNIPRRLKGKDIEPLERSEKNVEVEVKPRKLRRLYKRLLDKIP